MKTKAQLLAIMRRPGHSLGGELGELLRVGLGRANRLGVLAPGMARGAGAASDTAIPFVDNVIRLEAP